MTFSTHIREMDAALIVRVFLGIAFFFQGYDKVFRLGIKQVFQTIHSSLETKGMPLIFTWLGVYITSYIELVCGLFLIIGFVKYYCMYLLGFDLVFAAIAFGIMEPVWNMKDIFPRLVLLVFLLIIPAQWDVISVDYVWSIIKFIKSL